MENKLFTGLISGATLVSIYAVVQYFGYNPSEHFFYRYWRRGPGVGSTIGNQNFLGKYLVLIIPVIFSLCFYRLNLKKRLVAGLCLLLCFAALIATFTRASWLSVVVGLMLFLYLAFRNSLLVDKVKPLVVCLLMLLAMVVLFNFYAPQGTAGEVSSFKHKEPGAVMKRTVSAFQFREGRGVATRLYVWEKAMHLIMERPWFGYGLETFQIAFRPYNRDYTKRFNDFTTVDRIHNNYLDTAFSLGLTGLAAYLAIIASFLIFLLKLIREIKDKSRKLFYIGILSGFCGYLVNDLFIFSVVSVSPTFWSLMGLTIAAGRLEGSKGGTVNI
jgi:putative inorganic carbon (HCO3(-)) transporter